MTVYSEPQRETLQARRLLRQWLDLGLITAGQYRHLEQDTASDLSTTNIFLRIVLFLFTVLGVLAFAGLVFRIFFSHPSQPAISIFFLCLAVVSYAGAEGAIAHYKLYRHGIEEALAVCSTAFLYAGLQVALSGYHVLPSRAVQSLVPAAAAALSLWIWHRFDLWYAFLAAMILVGVLPDYWTSSPTAHIVIIAVLAASGLVAIVLTRSGRLPDTLKDSYALAEAFLWLGLYLTLNLKIPPFGSLAQGWGAAHIAPQPKEPFYWATWVLIWCLPPFVIARGIRRKDRLVLAAGALAAILTFISNKPYLGWSRHTWDPILLGTILTASSAFLRRWLADGPGGTRHGFTASSMSRGDRQALNTTSAAISLLSPRSITPVTQTSSPDVHFGGGSSGGGGATGDF